MQDDSARPSPFEGQRLWILVGGLIVLGLILAGGGYWWLKHSPKPAGAAAHPKLIGYFGESVNALDDALPAEDKICSTSLKRALDFGVLPQGTTLASSEAQAAQPEGRLTCQAQGMDGHYVLNIDTNCPGTQEKTCFALDSIRREDGTFTYKRRPWPASQG